MYLVLLNHLYHYGSLILVYFCRQHRFCINVGFNLKDSVNQQSVSHCEHHENERV
jgi:hypothetical protein